ncbi:xanthine dehydrogenase family protein molybdopterin-binding subunit [Mucilaginibacter sp. UR6-1]|uniref:xanthine dehydrogenase family protein molybdopterin-binding subunit n=1 Tax=Mucilaginibacter sp. UR6-1 TaxID=1435643 RepID=UPI001E453578|nr:xanthine dehydrogenase family protein molybdopterin-binding subunit [Mucilaginibacter sp. UR6-1]MCC8410787.1 xanthine dehydrogenase family protein molybdopterin-binding subunit [Mucilaginibacter sp. UR6-1]
MTEMNTTIGKPISRLEGFDKVTGAAKYAADHHVPDMLYGYVVNSIITKGRITKIHTDEVMALPGILEILTHENRMSTAWFDIQYADMDAPSGTVFKPLHDDRIKYNGQPIALVIAETFEQARLGAAKLRVEYKEEKQHATELKSNLERARPPKPGMAFLLKPPPPKPTGDFEKAYQEAAFRAEGEYHHSAEFHNPMELFASTVLYEGKGKLTIYSKTQGTINDQTFIANVFGLKYQNVRVIAPYVGGAFGSGLRPQHQLYLAAMAALQLKRHVRVVLDRSQMFTFGHRPQTLMQMRISADEDGKVTGLNHEGYGETSTYEDYSEILVKWAPMLYPAANTLLKYDLVPLDVATPLDMRAPGGSTAFHAIECTMDQLAYQLNIDPLELRIKNYSEVDPLENKPFTSKELKACYLQGAEKFGWLDRKPEPRSMRRGNKLVGYGMATGMWDAMQLPARVEARVTPDGKLHIKSAITDIGTGTFTIMTQIAAEQFGMAMEDVIFDYGNSALPFAPIQGGSFSTSTVGIAVVNASKALKKKLLKLAIKASDQFKSADVGTVSFIKGNIVYGDHSLSFVELVAANGAKPILTRNMGYPHALKLRKYAMAAHSAAFVEVEVDEELGFIKVTRALTAVAAGRIMNPKTARSQILGGMVWGISKALHEETLLDPAMGKYMNQNLAEYHLPVHADIHELEVLFVEEEDKIINELGTKGVGEIGLVAITPAIVNAIYHATGKRINDLPVHFDKLL